MSKKLSIITVNYNDKAGLALTIDSLKRQTWQDFEYIVIDGGSTDGSKELIEQYQDKIDFWVSEKDKGIYNAMNKGIKAATGDYLFFLNAGDFLYEDSTLDKVQSQIDGSIDYYYGNVIFKEPEKETLITYPDKLSFHFFTYNCVCHQTSFLRRSLFDDYFYYNEDLKIVSDWEFLIYTICQKNISYRHLDVTVSYYDFGGISSRPESEPQKRAERTIVMEKYFPTFIDDYAVMDELNSKRIRYILHIKKHKFAWKLLKAFANFLMLFLPKMEKTR